MPKARKPPKPKPQQLLVEGKDDRHVIWALCEKYQVPETFSVEVPTEEKGTTEEKGNGITVLLDGLPDRLRQKNLCTLGIVVDADRNLMGRWQAVSNRLNIVGYENIPKIPPPDGWVYIPPNSDLPKVGVWLMPDNQLPGMLEDFVAHLIPPEDKLRPKAELILQEIERENLKC